MSSHAANYSGILAMIGASAFFSANDAATKYAAQFLPVSEIVAVRGIFALMVALIVVAWRRELFALPAIRNPYLLLRALIEAVVGILAIYTLSQIPMANYTAIIMVQPFIITAIGAIWLGEDVGWRRWSAITAGFLGMLLVMRPATDDFQMVSLLALVIAVMSVTRDLLIRKIGADVPTTVISLSTALLALPVGLAGAAIEPWSVPDPTSTAIIFVAAAFLFAAFLLTVMAFRGTDVSVVSPFRYSIVVFSTFFGLAVFGEVPDTLSLTGIAIIVGAGLYLLHRETVRRRARPST